MLKKNQKPDVKYLDAIFVLTSQNQSLSFNFGTAVGTR